MTFLAAQGDVLLRAIPSLPHGLVAVEPESGRLILARGEATGHHHSFALSDRVALFREDGAGGGLFLSVSEAPVLLEHQEHSPFEVPPGQYEVVRQRVFTAGTASRVAD